MPFTPQSLLVHTTVPAFRADGKIFVESQAANGLRLYAANFPRVTVCVQDIGEEQARRQPPEMWRVPQEVYPLDNLTLVALPRGYRLREHLRLRPRIEGILRPLIEEADLLCLSVGGWFGDWGQLACRMAREMGRPYAVWTERVEYRIIRFEATKKKSPLRKVYSIAYSKLVRLAEESVIRDATLGLFHGNDCYTAYAPLLKRPGQRKELVHDLHLSPADRVSAEAALAKSHQIAARAASGDFELNLGYAGRAEDMKGPLQWLQIIQRARARGLRIKATWLGSGALAAEMQSFVAREGLGEVVKLPGFVSDRETVLQNLRAWDLLLFTHLTPESPRILLEALASATPIVGYDSAYARDLVQGYGGGDCLTPLADVDRAVQTLERLLHDPQRLARLVIESHATSEQYNDVATFRHRCDVIKAVLGAAEAAQRQA